MERLTNVGNKGEIYITDNDETRNIGRKEAAYKKLKEYEDLEEQGLLLRLPCKVGSAVYLICGRYTMCSKYGEKFEEYSCQGCEDECDSHKEYYIHKNTSVDLQWIARNMFKFGKTVFLTHEESEAALQKTKEENK